MDRYCLCLALVLMPTLLLASSKELSTDFYQRVDRFLTSQESSSERLVQEAHQLVKHLTEVTENREDFIQKVKKLKSYLRWVCDFTQQNTFQKTLLLEEEINTHVAYWNEETKRKRSTIAWTALAIGALIGLIGSIFKAVQEERLDLNKFQEIGVNILIWAPITIGGGLSLGNLIAAKEVEQRQVLLVHPSELVRAYSGDVTMYEIEAQLKVFLAAEDKASRSQAQKKIHALHSKDPERVSSRVHYMKEVIKYAPQELISSKEEQQKQLQVLQENLSLRFPSHSYFDEIRYFISDHMYGFAVAGAVLGVAIFLLSLHFSGGWSWPYAALSFLIGLNVGFSLGQMGGELLKKETPREILHHEVLF